MENIYKRMWNELYEDINNNLYNFNEISMTNLMDNIINNNTRNIGEYNITEMDVDFKYKGIDYCLNIDHSYIKKDKKLEDVFKRFLILTVIKKIAYRLDSL